MRGILSFLLVVLLAESLVFIYTYHNSEVSSSYYNEEQVMHLQKFYDKKIKIKRTIENIIAQPTVSSDPYDKVEEIAERLGKYESQVEADKDYRIDLWCGYVSPPVIDLMLESAKAGTFVKTPPVFDASTKVHIDIQGVPVEVHACSAVLVAEQGTNKIHVGRGALISTQDLSVLTPAIGVTIADENNRIYDVDFIS